MGGFTLEEYSAHNGNGADAAPPDSLLPLGAASLLTATPPIEWHTNPMDGLDGHGHWPHFPIFHHHLAATVVLSFNW